MFPFQRGNSCGSSPIANYIEHGVMAVKSVFYKRPQHGKVKTFKLLPLILT